MSLSKPRIRPAFYSQPNVIRPRTEQISTREDECLDEEPCFFCKIYDAEFSGKDLECSPNIFPLSMDSLFQVFKPLGAEHMTPAPPVVTPFNYLQGNNRQLRQGQYDANSGGKDDGALKFMDQNTVARANAFLDSLQPAQRDPATTNHRPTSSADSIRSSISTELTDALTVSSESSFGTIHRPSLPHSPSVVKGTQVEFLTEADRVAIAEIGWMRQMSPAGTRPFDPSQYIINPFWTNNDQGNKYLGTMSASSNQVSDLPDHLNTCVWLEGAPSDVTYPKMVNSIRNCGKLFSLHINPAKEKHSTSAAKIAFCTRIGAERFMSQAQSFTGVPIRGRRISVRWNRNKYRENANRAESRVLKISGPARYVNCATMIEYFSRLFYFHLIRVENLSPGVMIWEFGSILAQAHSAKQAIEREPALMMNNVRVEYAPDPCE